jgi:hypothetical protein
MEKSALCTHHFPFEINKVTIFPAEKVLFQTKISFYLEAVARCYSEGPPYQADLRVGERNRKIF